MQMYKCNVSLKRKEGIGQSKSCLKKLTLHLHNVSLIYPFKGHHLQTIEIFLYKKVKHIKFS